MFAGVSYVWGRCHTTNMKIYCIALAYGRYYASAKFKPAKYLCNSRVYRNRDILPRGNFPLYSIYLLRKRIQKLQEWILDKECTFYYQNWLSWRLDLLHGCSLYHSIYHNCESYRIGFYLTCLHVNRGMDVAFFVQLYIDSYTVTD